MFLRIQTKRKHSLLVDVVEGDEETAVGGGGDLTAEEVLDELGALGFGVDGLGTFLEIDREKSHCVYCVFWVEVVARCVEERRGSCLVVREE